MSVTRLALGTASFAALLFAAFSFPQDPKKEQDPIDVKVRRLMEMSGSGDLGKQVMDQMLEVFRKTPGLPDGFIDKFKETVKPDDLIDLIVPIYRKHLDEKTVDAAIAFASTEAGKKLHSAMPVILREAMEAGQAWGQQAAMKVMQEMRK